MTTCKQEEDMSLFIDNNLNDASHIGNIEIKKQKEILLNRIIEFDNWFRSNDGRIIFNSSSAFWNTEIQINTNDEDRIKLLKDKVIPRFLNCTFFTENLKNKVSSGSEEQDPQNIGAIITNSKYGESLYKFSFMKNANEYMQFHSSSFLDDGTSGNIDLELRRISYEEAKFYHLSMIKIYSKSQAVYKINTDMSNAPCPFWGYLIVNLQKENNNWLIDNIYYIEQDELVEDSTNSTYILDYELNRESYKTGIYLP
jgi:hypothetical protein